MKMKYQFFHEIQKIKHYLKNIKGPYTPVEFQTTKEIEDILESRKKREKIYGETPDYDINLGNTDHSIRRNADSDFISFWDKQAKLLSWFKNWENTLDWNPPFAKWFVGGKINASFNALDVHQNSKSRKTAIFWEGEDGTS